MSEPAIKVDGLSKRYRIGVEEEQHDTLFGAMASWVQSPMENYRRVKRLSAFGKGEADDIIWALKDVSFEVERGEVVGVIGRNGAGKSTLLKILSHITEPTSGYAKIRGRVSSLLEVGTGFHDELTGRENVYLNGTILGMSKAEVDRKFDEIVAFSGVEKFIDTPVKRYSSGMKVRLAFAVAAHLEPEILLVDEVLAVGDVGFQKKCLGKMEDVTQEGRTVLFVSHNMSMVSALCPRCLLLERGHIVADNETEKVVDRYHASIDRETRVSLRDREDRKGTGELRFTEVGVRRGGSSSNQSAIISGGPVEFRLHWESEDGDPISDVAFVIRLRDQYGSTVLTLHTRFAGLELSGVPATGSIVCHVPSLPLAHGIYRVDVRNVIGGQSGAAGAHPGDHVNNAAKLEVSESDFFGTGERTMPRKHGYVVVDHQWKPNFKNEPSWAVTSLQSSS
jgi:lipopolysaccharide transport system ATP-binding protein